MINRFMMKRNVLLSILLLTFSWHIQAEDPLSVDDFAAQITFDTSCINLGDLASDSGERKFEFKFVNSGNAPLVLTYVHPSCSCVKMEYPRTPIAPGDSACIKGVLNPSSIHEKDFKRNILVRSNASN